MEIHKHIIIAWTALSSLGWADFVTIARLRTLKLANK